MRRRSLTRPPARSRSASSAWTTRSPARPSPYSGGRSAGALALQRGPRGVRVEPDEHVPARLHGLRPLRSVPKRHARHAGQVGLLLHAAGVGQHGARVQQQRGEVQVAERRHEPHPGGLELAHQPRGLQPRARARVQREHDRVAASRTAARRGAPAAPGRRRCPRGARSRAGSRPARRRTPPARRCARGRAAPSSCATSTITSPDHHDLAGDALGAQVLGRRRGRSTAAGRRRGRSGRG